MSVDDTVSEGAELMVIEPAGDGASADPEAPPPAAAPVEASAPGEAAAPAPAPRPRSTRPPPRTRRRQTLHRSLRRSRRSRRSRDRRGSGSTATAAGRSTRRRRRAGSRGSASSTSRRCAAPAAAAGSRATTSRTRPTTPAAPAARRAPATPAARPATAPSGGAGLDLLPWPKVDFEKFGPVERVARTRIQRISAPNLARNWVMIPHVTHNDEADITELEEWRKLLNKQHEREGVKFTMVSFLVKASVAALQAVRERQLVAGRRRAGAQALLQHRLRGRHPERAGRAGDQGRRHEGPQARSPRT